MRARMAMSKSKSKVLQHHSMASSKPRRTSALAEDDKEEMLNVYKSRIMVHDIHRVRELSALLEERRRYFDGQLGEVYRSAGVSSPASSLPRLRGLDSPPISASASDSQVTDLSLLGSHIATGPSIDLQSARSYSVFADDECSVPDSYEFAETKARLGRNWSSSTLLGPPNPSKSNQSSNTTNGSSRHKYSSGQGLGTLTGKAAKDSIYNEVMRTADLEKKLKARRSSLPLALEASLKRPLKKKILIKTNSRIRKDKETASLDEPQSVKNVAASLLTKTTGYPDFSDGDEYSDSLMDPSKSRPKSKASLVPPHGTSQTFSNKINIESRKFVPDSGDPNQRFSMTDVLSRTRQYDLGQEIKGSVELRSHYDRRLSGYFSQTNPSSDSTNINSSGTSWDADIVGGAPRRKAKKFSPSGSKSTSSTLAPLMSYSPRSSLSTLSGSYPRIAFSSLEKYYREEGDKSHYPLNSSHLLLKPVPKIDMSCYAEPSHAEPDYSHDFRFLSLIDALVPCLQPTKTSWKPQRLNHMGGLGFGVSGSNARGDDMSADKPPFTPFSIHSSDNQYDEGMYNSELGSIY